MSFVIFDCTSNSKEKSTFVISIMQQCLWRRQKKIHYAAMSMVTSKKNPEGADISSVNISYYFFKY